jgi:phage shock protein PspC (stress-responsive transcriptional regulator)
MKKSIKVNIGGVVFHIDEDAYDLLRNYLDQLDARFKPTPGGSEILSDIEIRMAELFQAKITPEKEVLTLEDAKEIIDIMGEPEEIDEETPQEEPVAEPRQAGRRARRMYRDPDNHVAGGVCAGLGAYFNIDPVFIRIIFVIFTLTYGVGILVYLLLWAVIPVARTAADKLEMSGEPVNVYNIERRVRKDYRETGTAEGIRSGRRGSNFISDMIRVIARIFLVFFKIIGGIILVSLAIAGIAVLAALISVAFGVNPMFFDGDWSLAPGQFREMLALFVSPAGGTIGFIALFVLVAIPVLALLYGLAKWIFRFKANDRAVGITSAGVAVVALIVLLVIGANEAVQYSTSGRSKTESNLVLPAGRTLVVKALPVPEDMDDNSMEFLHAGEFRVSRISDSLAVLVPPRIQIECSRDSVAAIRVEKTSRGPNFRQAAKYAEEMDYAWQLSDTTLTFEPFYRLGSGERFHAQELEVRIDLPVGTRIYLDKSMKNLLYAIDNTEDTWSASMVEDEWVMTPDGLARVLKNQPAPGN